MDTYSYIANSDAAYVDQLYQSYKQDTSSVDASWQKFFEGFEFSLKYGETNGTATGNGAASNGTHIATNGAATNGTAKTATPLPTAVSAGTIQKEIAVRNFIHAYRKRGHLAALTNPIRKRKDRQPLLDLSDFGLTEADMDTVFQMGSELGLGPAKLRDIAALVQKIYLGPIGFEYMYIREPAILAWFKMKVEKEWPVYQASHSEKTRILEKLNQAVVFENFLHTKYLGQKRFSLEGGETTIAALDAMITKAADMGVAEIMIGMAHRGRLNVLANVMGKTYDQIFNEFEGNLPEEIHGDGDVKYHTGFSSQQITPNGKAMNLKLAPNPSHLEAVNPVVEGFIRARADGLYDRDYDKVMPVLIHGDAAFAGQGVVYEVAQMSKLAGYHTGGTFHFVINNQVGFTTDFEDARSSIYCSDVAKIIDAPVLHVNGDNPEAVVFCMKLAVEFREQFNRDIFVDMVCYRRHGHNESDEPKFTQPTMYAEISHHPNPRELYLKQLIAENEVSAELATRMDAEFKAQLQERLDMVKQKTMPYRYGRLEQNWKTLRLSAPNDFDQSPETGVALETLEKIGQALITVPDGFKPLKQIEKLLADRQKMIFETKVINWGVAELLAYGSILAENKVVRLSGQDVQRGTFSHRHAVLHDSETNDAYNSLNHIQDNQETFEVYNSLLSEYGVLGFEFGYALANSHALVIWEAQFGDFANGAQVMIDQFISCCETKWNRMNGLVMLLPHGYEGQGPEHSNARPERYLQLSADYNMTVANITTPANFFHLLRRQLAWPFRKPLVVMSPKSGLRNASVISPLEDLTKGRFLEVIGDGYADPKKVKRVLLCTGKVYYELLEKQQADARKDVAIVRMEQIAPLPKTQLDAVLGQYKRPELVWVQEEPANMGYWNYLQRVMPDADLRVVSRQASASPSTGYAKIHAREQAEVITNAFN